MSEPNQWQLDAARERECEERSAARAGDVTKCGVCGEIAKYKEWDGQHIYYCSCCGEHVDESGEVIDMPLSLGYLPKWIGN